MSSKLHIGKLPYSANYDEISIFTGFNIQFTTDIEIILTIDELDIMLKHYFLMKELKYRMFVELFGDVERTYENNNELTEEGYSMEEQLAIISRDLGYLTRDFNIFNQEISESINKIREALIKFKPNKLVYEEIINDIINWAKKYFVEGAHYFYTL